jgi:hypothetical protein
VGYRVKNWRNFQHYKDRNPPWIKLHFSLLSSEDWVTLDDSSRVLAVACMLIASRNEGVIPSDMAYLKRVAYLNKPPNLKPLIDCGFLEADSESKQTLADARPETEAYTSTEKKTEGEVFVLPDWLPKDEWKALLEVRKGKKVQNTPRAQKLLLAELERLKSLGHDPAKVLDQSTLKSWLSVYPLKPELVALQAEPKAQLCDYCTKPSTGAVNGRRACSEHWQLAMDNERPARIAA